MGHRAAVVEVAVVGCRHAGFGIQEDIWKQCLCKALLKQLPRHARRGQRRGGAAEGQRGPQELLPAQAAGGARARGSSASGARQAQRGIGCLIKYHFKY